MHFLLESILPSPVYLSPTLSWPCFLAATAARDAPPKPKSSSVPSPAASTQQAFPIPSSLALHRPSFRSGDDPVAGSSPGASLPTSFRQWGRGTPQDPN